MHVCISAINKFKISTYAVRMHEEQFTDTIPRDTDVFKFMQLKNAFAELAILIFLGIAPKPQNPVEYKLIKL